MGRGRCIWWWRGERTEVADDADGRGFGKEKRPQMTQMNRDAEGGRFSRRWLCVILTSLWCFVATGCVCSAPMVLSVRWASNHEPVVDAEVSIMHERVAILSRPVPPTRTDSLGSVTVNAPKGPLGVGVDPIQGGSYRASCRHPAVGQNTPWSRVPDLTDKKEAIEIQIMNPK